MCLGNDWRGFKEKMYARNRQTWRRKYMILGCSSAAGLGMLHHTKGIMNAAYILALRRDQCCASMKEHFWCHPATFQLDNGLKYVAKATASWLPRQIFKVVCRPLQSPALKPVKNLWEMVNQTRERCKGIKNADELWNKTWSTITPDVCLNLVESMPTRPTEVIKNKSYHKIYLFIC